jgi:hypothetical protein
LAAGEGCSVSIQAAHGFGRDDRSEGGLCGAAEWGRYCISGGRLYGGIGFAENKFQPGEAGVFIFPIFNAVNVQVVRMSTFHKINLIDDALFSHKTKQSSS